MDGIRNLQIEQIHIEVEQRCSFCWTIKNCQSYRILKIYEDFSTRCAILFAPYLQNGSMDNFQILHSERTHLENVPRRSFPWKKNCQNYRILKIYEDLLHIWLDV